VGRCFCVAGVLGRGCGFGGRLRRVCFGGVRRFGGSVVAVGRFLTDALVVASGGRAVGVIVVGLGRGR
jgi:hypothetical protein